MRIEALQEPDGDGCEEDDGKGALDKVLRLIPEQERFNMRRMRFCAVRAGMTLSAFLTLITRRILLFYPK